MNNGGRISKEGIVAAILTAIVFGLLITGFVKAYKWYVDDGGVIGKVEEILEENFQYKESKDFVIKDKEERTQKELIPLVKTVKLVDITLQDEGGEIVKVSTTDAEEYDKRFLGDTVTMRVGEDVGYMYTEDSSAVYIVLDEVEGLYERLKAMEK